MKRSAIFALTVMACFSLLVGCGQSSSADSSATSDSTSKTAQQSKEDVASASYSKVLKKQQESYSTSESHKTENVARNNISIIGTKYVTYVFETGDYHEFWGLNLKKGENYSNTGRIEYQAYEFLPGNQFYWIDVVALKEYGSKSYVARRGTYKVNGNSIEFNYAPNTWYRWTIQDNEYKVLSNDPGSDDTSTEVFSLTEHIELTADYSKADGSQSEDADKAQEPVTPEVATAPNSASINVKELYDAAQAKFSEVGKLEIQTLASGTYATVAWDAKTIRVSYRMREGQIVAVLAREFQ